MAQLNNKADLIHTLCKLLIDNKKSEGIDFVNKNYPFVIIEKVSSRQYTKYEMMKIFLRDGFIDRYSGEKLLFPGLIRLLTLEIPDVFKYHLNWKMSETHMIYWDLFPTIDHIMPIARGGNNNEDNWITTSQLRNSAKSNFTLEELGWDIIPKGNLEEWDGLCTVFLNLMNGRNLTEVHIHKEDWKYITEWKEALIKAKGNSVPKIVKKISMNNINAKENITNLSLQSSDLKNLPVGTISRNKSTQNRYVTLKQENDKLIVYSDIEDICMTISTKPLLVNIEFTPNDKVSKIVQLPKDIYSTEQLEFIKKACKKLCKGKFKNLSEKELSSNTIYQYLLEYR